MSEVGVIGAILSNPALWDEAAQLVSSGDFSSRKTRAAWDDICALIQAGEPVDALILSERGHDLAMLGDAQVNALPSALPRYARQVRDESRRRQAAAIVGDTFKRLQDPRVEIDKTLSHTQASLEALHAQNSQGYYDAGTLHDATTEFLREAAEAAEATGLPGVPTGLLPINRMIGGWRKRKLYGLSARPGVGKTSLAMQTAVYAASKGYPVGICQLEMDAQEMAARSHANLSNVPYWKLTQGDPEALRAASRVKLPDGIFIDDATRDIHQICARITQWRRKYDIQVAYVDHLGLIKSDDNENRTRQLGEISFELKTLAKRLDIAVVVLLQLNRQVEHRTGQPTLADLRGSGEIEENLDAALFLHSSEDRNGRREVDIGALKNRGGPLGWSPAPLLFDAIVQRWSMAKP